MKFRTKEEYIAWVSEWKAEHKKLVEIQKLGKYTRKSVNHTDVWYSDEQLEYILSLYTGNNWVFAQISWSLKNKLYGNKDIVYVHRNLKRRLNQMYSDRINGKKFYHEYLNMGV